MKSKKKIADELKWLLRNNGDMGREIAEAFEEEKRRAEREKAERRTRNKDWRHTIEQWLIICLAMFSMGFLGEMIAVLHWILSQQ